MKADSLLALLLSSFSLLASGVCAEASRRVALLSVSTDMVWLEVARPESRRPPIVITPLEQEPYSSDDISKMSDAAQAEMIRQNGVVRERNRRLEEANAELVQRSLAADAADTRARQRAARSRLMQTPLGRAVAAVPQLFGPICSSNGTFVVLTPGQDDIYLSVTDDDLLVSILFQEPKKNPKLSPVPNTSNDPVRILMPVILKAESLDGRVFFTDTFEQKLVVCNQDRILGKDYDRILEQMVRDAMREVAKRLSETKNK